MNAIKAFVDLSKYLGSSSTLDEMLEAKESVVSKQDPAPAPVGCALASIPKRPPTADSSPPSPPPSPPPPPQQQEPAQEEQQQKRPTRTVAMAETVPPEIFMKICEFLPPLDLLSLEGVCRRFCEFLRTRDSPKTQDIWRKARLRFMPTLPMPPPNGMDEYAYVRLGVMELGCQFCSRTVVPKICWEFRVRCCRKCLIKRTVSDVPEVAEKLVSGMPTFVSCLPFVTVDHQQKRYWGEQVRKAMEEYDALPETPDTPPGDLVPATWDADTPVWGGAEHKTPSRDASGECGSGSRSENGNGDENEHYVGRPTAKEEWRLQRFVKTKEILQDSIARAAAEKQGRKVWRKQNKQLLQNLLARLVSESKSANEAGKRVVLKAEDLKKCPSYLKASCSLDSPLSETTLEALKQKIADEYEYVSREDLIRKRQNDLFQTIVRIRNAVKEAWRAGRASNRAGSSERKQRASSSRTLKDPQRSLAAIGMRVLGNVAGERVHSVAKQPNLNFIQPLDSALKHIRMCKSYNNPKFPDDNPQQPWDEDFLYDSLIPAICREAEGIEEVERGQQSCFGVRKALVQGWGDQQVFKCSLCRNRKHYTYQGIQQHLRSTLHRVRRVIEDDMIEVQLMHGVMMEEDSVWLAHLPLPAVYDETDAVVKVYMSGVCETDLKNEWCTTDSSSTREQRTIPGHQFVGVIHDLGKSVPGFAVGDRVISTPKTRCGECSSCTSPASSFCLRAQVYGWTWDGKRLDGGQAEYVRVPFASDALIKIPDEVSDKEAILLSEPLTCGYHCAKTGLAQFAESERHALKVVVLGCGPVGLSAVAAVQHLGCQSANVYAVDVNAERLDLAHQFGATKIKFSRESWLQHDQLNADLLLYTSDAIELTSLTVALRPGAVICIGMSNCSRRTEVRVPTDIDVFITSKLCSIKETIPEAIDLVLARKWNLESIVGTVVQLRDSEDVYKTQRSNLESYVMVGLLVNRNTH